MDTKSKSFNRRNIISLAIFLLLLFLSAGMYSLYPVIKEQAKSYGYNIFEKENFLSNLRQSNYCLYFDTIKNKESDTLKPSDILIDTKKSYENNNSENLKDLTRSFDNEIYNNQETLDGRLKNLDYYAVNKENKLIKERNNGGLNVLLNDNPDQSSIEALNNRYDFYVVIDYNDKGDMTIKRIYGADKLVAADLLNNYRNAMVYNLEIKPIKNMTYVYAVPKELQYKDLISNYKVQGEMNSYKMAEMKFINTALVLILIVGLVVPYKLSKELAGFKKIIKIPVEIGTIICIFTIGMVMYEASYSIINKTLQGNLINVAPMIISSTVSNILVTIINICYWVISFGIVFISVVLLKHIWNIGIRQYLSGSSIIYRTTRSLWRTSKRVYSYFRNIDLSKKENKKLAILLGINLLILSVMSALWFFGIILALIYTVVLYRIVAKNYEDIRYKYNKLFEATNKIAQGNLDVKIEEDLGIFNAFKSELQNIQRGFKMAVNEEVKSQKMKTELITNVSHDLKTPLTSIITYVDLLKDENLTIDKRSEYLDTLDRKSQRLKDLIEDLFEVSKATSGNITMNIVDVDIVALMKQTLLELDDKISKASLRVKTNYTDEKIILPLDSQRMFRVFENLIINITKYALEGSRVYIDIFNSLDCTQIILKNMAASEINFNVDEIMERFVRGDKSRNTEGSGLGLAIAKSFVELQGGRLEIIIDGDLFKVIITFNKTY